MGIKVLRHTNQKARLFSMFYLSNRRQVSMGYVMFKKRAAVFYRSIKTRGVAECFYSDKTRAASFLNGFKNIAQKACLLGFQTKVRIVRGKY